MRTTKQDRKGLRQEANDPTAYSVAAGIDLRLLDDIDELLSLVRECEPYIEFVQKTCAESDSAISVLNAGVCKLILEKISRLGN